MAGLALGFPNVKDQASIDRAFAAIQTWANRPDAFGRMVAIPYAQEWFGESAGTWTVDQGDVTNFSYSQLASGLLLVRAKLIGTTTSAGMGVDLRLRLPAIFIGVDSGLTGTVAWTASGGAAGVGVVYVSSDQKYLRLLRDMAGTAWPSGETNTLNVDVTALVPVVVNP